MKITGVENIVRFGRETASSAGVYNIVYFRQPSNGVLVVVCFFILFHWRQLNPQLQYCRHWQCLASVDLWLCPLSRVKSELCAADCIRNWIPWLLTILMNNNASFCESNSPHESNCGNILHARVGSSLEWLYVGWATHRIKNCCVAHRDLTLSSAASTFSTRSDSCSGLNWGEGDGCFC